MKNWINTSNNVILIVNTYRCLFFKTATKLKIFYVVRHLWPCQARRVRDSVEIESFWNLQRSKFVNLNGAKMVDVWNVNKLTEANEVGANVNFGISIWNTEYRIRNMSVCFDSMPATTFFLHHNKLLNNHNSVS